LFHASLNEITEIYQAGFVEGEGINLINVETSKNLGL
jgi:hypothetical protein